MFITVESIDGAGKTTIVEQIKNYYKDLKIKIYHEPNTLKHIIEEVIENNLDNPLLPEILGMLFSTDRTINQVNINNWLSDYDLVIFDRYYLSTLAYQGAMGADINFLRSLQKKARKPDITFFVDVNPEIAFKRVKSRGGKIGYFETLEFQKKVYKQFKLLLMSERNIYQIRNDAKFEIKQVTNIIESYQKNHGIFIS